MTSARIASALGAACALAATACADLLDLGDPSLVVSCDESSTRITRQFVIDSFDAPTNSAEAEEVGFDVDGDGRSDNAVFAALAAFGTAAPELELQGTINSLLTSGSLLQLLEAELGNGCARTTLYEGADIDVPVNPDDNFSGGESFRVIGNPRGRMTGGRDDDAVLDGPGGSAELRLPLFRGTSPIDLPLIEARIRYVVTEDGAIEGAIGGAVRVDVVEGLVLPSLAQSLQAVVSRDCSGTAPTCCPQGSAGQIVLDVFDDDDDCAIAIDELRGDSLIRTIFAPDVDLYNGAVHEPNVDGIDDAVSIGIGFTAVNAFFQAPISP